MSLMPMVAGSPTWIGAPWTAGKRDVTCTARTTCSCGIGRMETTMGPEKAPAGVVGMDVLNMGTLVPHVMWRISMPAFMSAVSKEKLQPSRKDTRSSRQKSARSVISAVSSPCS